MSPGFLLLSLLIIAAYPSLIWKESNVTSSFLEKRGSFIGRTLTTSSMWILGGYVPTDDVGTDMIEYDIEKGSYIKHQNEYNFGYQNTQSYTQNEDILYMMPSAQNTINVFDLSSATIIDTISGYIGTSTTSRCLTYYKEYLLFLGGYPATNEFIIYSIQNKTWINSTPIPMNIESSSCHVVHDILYLIGGYDTIVNIQNTVRSIDISAIPNINTNWNTMENTLSVQKYEHRSVVVDDMIYIIGGMDNTISYTRTVDIIDTNNQIIYPDADLPRYIHLPAVIVANNILYLFCGQPYTSNYMYAVLPFENPTTESPQTSDVTTSIYPTISSSHPTSQPPSSYPVSQPSIQPSLDPSAQPTTSNTIHEQTTSNTVHQTFVNTMVTKKQTINPSKTPTQFPTNYSTPMDAVTTKYEVTIDVICADVNYGTDTAECDVDPNALNEVIESILVAAGTNVRIISTDIINDDLVIVLSVETGPENILKPGFITDHIEAQIKDNDDFGDVETEQKDDDFDDVDDIEANDDHGILVSIFVVSIFSFVVLIFCVCCVKLFQYYKKKQMKIKKMNSNMIRMASDNGRGEEGAPDSIEAMEYNERVLEMTGNKRNTESIAENNDMMTNTRVTIDAMKNDKIVLGIISTKKDPETSSSNADNMESTSVQTARDAMIHDKIVRGIVSTRKANTYGSNLQLN